ncbi:MAG: hypothetical protein ABI670_19215 [Chloroflexota bacterium]
MFEMRDEYAASQTKGLGCGFWGMWVLATTLGGGIGYLAGQSLTMALLPADATIYEIVLAAVPAGIILGLCVGVLQGLLLLRYIKFAGWREWVGASIVGGVLRWAVLGPISSVLILGMNTGIAVCNVLIPLALFGAVSGAAFGLPQAFVLSRHLRQTSELEWWTWTLANAAGGVFYLPFVMLSGLSGSAIMAMGGAVTQDAALRALIAVTLNWLLTGIITGLPIIDRLKHANRPTYIDVG